MAILQPQPVGLLEVLKARLLGSPRLELCEDTLSLSLEERDTGEKGRKAEEEEEGEGRPGTREFLKGGRMEEAVESVGDSMEDVSLKGW